MRLSSLCAPVDAFVMTAGVVRSLHHLCDNDNVEDDDDKVLIKGERYARHSQQCSQVASLPKSETPAHAARNLQPLLSVILL